jgi:hypothetical protein
MTLWFLQCRSNLKPNLGIDIAEAVVLGQGRRSKLAGRYGNENME